MKTSYLKLTTLVLLLGIATGCPKFKELPLNNIDLVTKQGEWNSKQIDLVTTNLPRDFKSDCRIEIAELRVIKTQGKVKIQTDGKLVEYQPAPDFFGSDEFEYKLRCGNQTNKNWGKVTVRILAHGKVVVKACIDAHNVDSLILHDGEVHWEHRQGPSKPGAHPKSTQKNTLINNQEWNHIWPGDGPTSIPYSFTKRFPHRYRLFKPILVTYREKPEMDAVVTDPNQENGYTTTVTLTTKIEGQWRIEFELEWEEIINFN